MANDIKFSPYKKCCRTCLKEDSLMFDLFVERIESLGSSISEMLISSTKLNIHNGDPLPNQICRYCFKCLLAFSHFIVMAQKSEEKLKEAILLKPSESQNICASKVIEIKIENDGHNNLLFDSQVDNNALYITIDENNKNSDHFNSNKVNSEYKEKDNEAEKPRLSCVQCKKQFSKISKLKHHEEKYKNKGRCKLFIETKPNKNPLPSSINDENPNVINESKDSDLTCIVCSARFESISLLATHFKSHEGKDNMNSCQDYNEILKPNSNFVRHNMIHENQCPQIDSFDTITPKENVNINICEPKDQFQCSKCLSTFKNINSLSAHMRKHTEKGRVISCKECNKVFKKLSHLKRHEIQHEVNCPFKCNVCPKSLPTKDALEEHVNKHRGVKPHRCPVCDKRFSHLSTLTTHIKIHTREKVYLCPTCGKKLNSSTNLNQHMLRHTGLREFACTLCPKKFVSKGELKSHTITHTGERSYTCDQCGATFTKRSSLTKHKIRHLGLKPHQCDTCLMRFTCKYHLKRHYRIHTGEKPYKCDMCGRAFTQSNDLVKHRRSHLGDKIYKCPQCTKSFRLNSELRQHISEHFVTSQTQTMNVAPPIDGVGGHEFLKPLAKGIATINVNMPQVDSKNDNK